jgi:hypothetical protein
MVVLLGDMGHVFAGCTTLPVANRATANPTMVDTLSILCDAHVSCQALLWMGDSAKLGPKT